MEKIKDIWSGLSKKGKIDSLELEIMDLGRKLDSMTLVHDYNFTFTN